MDEQTTEIERTRAIRPSAEEPEGHIADVEPCCEFDGEIPAALAQFTGVITALAELPQKALLDESAMAKVFSVTPRTIRRMVQRFELPPPIPFAGRSIWLAGRVLAFRLLLVLASDVPARAVTMTPGIEHSDATRVLMFLLLFQPSTVTRPA